VVSNADAARGRPLRSEGCRGSSERVCERTHRQAAPGAGPEARPAAPSCDKRRAIRETSPVAAHRTSPRRLIASRPTPSCPTLRLALGLFGGGLLVLVACDGREQAAPSPSAEVVRERIERVVVATGTIQPGKEIAVRPRIPGIIEKIHVEAGDVVKPGQLLVEIERDLLASQVREAEAAVREARVERRYAKIDLERAGELERSGASSPQKGDLARARHERAEAAVARAEAALETLSTQLSYASVVSPLEGRVLDVSVEEGTAVSPVTSVTGGTLLLSLAATDTLHLEGLVDENEVVRVEVGQPARIRTEAFGDRVFEGRVRKIAPIGTRIQNVTYFEVEIEVTDADAALLRPRMSGDGEIVTDVVDDALVVPETTLHYRGDRIYVDLQNGAEPPESREVEIGIVDGARVQVVSGLEGGESLRLQ
jgi:HlyD family secretion protein